MKKDRITITRLPGERERTVKVENGLLMGWVSTDEKCPRCKRTGWVEVREWEGAVEPVDQEFRCEACSKTWWNPPIPGWDDDIKPI